MEIIKLIGVLIVVIGFILKLDTLAVVVVAYHSTTIINYFEERLTNASAESFNAKIKAFRRV